jgi:thiol:disulfide interchange protein
MPGDGKEEKASGMKIIVSPFLWFLFLQGAGLLLLLRWGSIERGRALIRLLLVLVFLLTIISTQLTSNWLKNTLAIHPTENSNTPPDVIFVLAGQHCFSAGDFSWRAGSGND